MTKLLLANIIGLDERSSCHPTINVIIFEHVESTSR